MKPEFLSFLNKNKKIIGCDIKVRFMDQIICTDEDAEYEFEYKVNQYMVYTSKLLNRQIIDLLSVNFDSFVNEENSYQDYFNKLIDNKEPAYQYFKDMKRSMVVIECENPAEVQSMHNEIVRDDEFVFIRNSDTVVLLVNRDDIRTYCLETMNSIEVELMQKATLAYSDYFTDINKLSDIYSKCVESIKVGKVFNVRNKVFSVHDNKIEKLLNYLDYDKRNELLASYPEIETLNTEELQTISYLFENNLNITKTSKALYIHRNTLVYRIDKINKKMSLDILDFNDALILRILLILRKIEK